MAKKKTINIDLPYVGQCRSSAACGSCALKMAIDYYHNQGRLKHTYSVASLTKHLKVSRKWGMEETQAANFLRSIGLNMTPIKISHLQMYLEKKIPILALFEDEFLEGHYAIIKGLNPITDEILFHDPWPDFGPNFKRSFPDFRLKLAPFAPENLWALAPATVKT